MEPQQTGSWHIHLLVKQINGQSLFIPNEETSKLWGHGFTSTCSIHKGDNFGAYYSARFVSLDLFEPVDCIDNTSKLIIKGARLQFYPPSFKFYRTSHGIIKPQAEIMTYSEAIKIVSEFPPVYQTSTSIIKVTEDGKEETVNTLTYEQYNTARIGGGK